MVTIFVFVEIRIKVMRAHDISNRGDENSLCFYVINIELLML